MAITGLIRSPQSFIDSLMDQMQRQQEGRLRQAQTQEASGKGAQASMIANLMGQAFGASPDQSTGNMASPVMNNSQPAMSNSAGSMATGNSPANAPTDRQQRAKNILYALGFLKPTPGEEEAKDIRETGAKKQIETTGTAAQKLEDEARDIKESRDLWQQIKDTQDANKDATGWYHGALASVHKYPNPATATLNTLYIDKLGDMTKRLSQRGGATAASLVQGGKPSAYNDYEANNAMATAALETHDRKFKFINDLYKKKTGKDLDFSSEDAGVQSNDGAPNQGQVNPNPALSSGTKAPQIKPNLTDKGMVVLYKGNKEYHLPPKLMKQALSEGFSLTSGEQ